MFSKLATSVLTLVIPLVSALTLNAPSNLSSGGSATITWTPDPANDPPAFSLELTNTVFHNSFAIGNNIPPSLGSITLTLPIVPAGAGYTLQAVQIGNINTVYSTSAGFAIAPTISSSVSSTSSGSSSSRSSAASSASGVTTTPSSTITPAGSVSGTSTSPNAVTSSTVPFNGAVASLHFGFNSGSIAVILLSAVAGAAVVAL